MHKTLYIIMDVIIMERFETRVIKIKHTIVVTSGKGNGKDGFQLYLQCFISLKKHLQEIWPKKWHLLHFTGGFNSIVLILSLVFYMFVIVHNKI